MLADLLLVQESERHKNEAPGHLGFTVAAGSIAIHLHSFDSLT